MTINAKLSDRELSDLRHKYRADPEATRIIEALEAERKETRRLADALRVQNNLPIKSNEP